MLQVRGLERAAGSIQSIREPFVRHDIGDMQYAAETEGILAALGGVVMPGDRFDNRVWKAPETQQVGSDLRMLRVNECAGVRQPLLALRSRSRRSPGSQHKFSQIVQYAGKECRLGKLAR